MMDSVGSCVAVTLQRSGRGFTRGLFLILLGFTHRARRRCSEYFGMNQQSHEQVHPLHARAQDVAAPLASSPQWVSPAIAHVGTIMGHPRPARRRYGFRSRCLFKRMRSGMLFALPAAP